jgi:hypothetical protein
MTSIQMFLALGAVILLSIVIMNTNKNSLHTEDVMYDSNFGITATSIASSIIEDASKKSFDNNFYYAVHPDSPATKVTNANDFTPPADLGIDSGEDINDPTTFNDFDDYNNYTAVDSTMPSAIFNISCRVYYVNSNNLDGISMSPDFHKKISVKVWSVSMKDTIVMSSIYSYWNFLP